MPQFNEVSDIGMVELRIAFRALLNSNKAFVPKELHGEKTPAKWLASSNQRDLSRLITEQNLESTILTVANSKYVAPEGDVQPATEAAEQAAPAPVNGTHAIQMTQGMAQVTAPGVADPGAMFAAMVAPHLKLGLNKGEIESLVKREVKAALDGSEPRVLVVKGPATEKQTEDARHVKLERLLLYVAQRQHVFLVGPAGTGKSHAAHQVADLLGLGFYSISVGLQSTQADLFGFMNAHGVYVRTQFRDAYEKGGVFCLDEMDGGSANVLNALNSALANGSVAFPDGRIQRHPDFVVVATGNTWGAGKTMEYVGRAVLDGAFLSRFARMFWPVDEKLEMKLGAIPAWTKYVQAVRKLFDARGIKAIVAPRISIAGGQMIAAGQTVADTIDDYIRAGLTQDASKLLDTVQPPTVVR
jgi:cobaltochelatase CobS